MSSESPRSANAAQFVVPPPPPHLTGAERRAALDALAVSLGAVNKPIHLSDSESVIEGPVKNVFRLATVAPTEGSLMGIDADGDLAISKIPPEPFSLQAYVLGKVRVETLWQFRPQNVVLMLPGQVAHGGTGLTESEVRREEGGINVILQTGLDELTGPPADEVRKLVQQVRSPNLPFPPPSKARLFKVYYQWPPQPLPSTIDEASFLESRLLEVPISTAYVPIDFGAAHLGAALPRSSAVIIDGQQYVPMEWTQIYVLSSAEEREAAASKKECRCIASDGTEVSVQGH